MSWDNDATGYLAELSRQPGAQQPATISEVWNSEWQRNGLDTAGGLGGLYDEARGQLVGAIEAASGQGIDDYARSRGVRLGGFLTTAQDYEALAALADTLPEDKRKAVEPLKDIRLNASKRAQKLESDASAVGDNTYGLSAHAVAFLAGVARQSIDPANLAAMVVTAPLGGRGGSLLSFIGREAGANAAAQAMVEPVIQPMRADLGLDAGFGRAAGNILEAGVGGAIIGGGLHLAGRGLRRVVGERPAESTSAPAPAGSTIASPDTIQRASGPDTVPAQPSGSRAADQFAPDDFHAAGDLADRDHVVDLMSPDATAAGRFDHAAKVEEVASRIDAVDKIPTNALPAVADNELLGEFFTAKGSKYVVHEDGTTTRDKAARADVGHEGDSGLKQRTARTIYVDANVASALSGAGIQGANEKGFRLVIIGDKATLVSWNEAGGKWGASPSSRDIPFTTTPQVGKAPVELWKPANDVPGREAYRGQHAGNAITSFRPASAPAKAVNVTPKVPRGRAGADAETWSLLEFIASKGGLKPDPELAAVFGTKGGPFVPGFGKLIRKTGKTLDDALTSAKEAGYLFDAQDVQGGALQITIRDLLDVIDAENRGQKLYKPGRAKEAPIDEVQEAHAIIGALEKELFDTGGGDIRVDNAIADRVVQIVRQEKETDLLSAYERAIMEDAERYEALAAARSQDAELGKIEGWDADARAADEPGAASRDGAADPGQRGSTERAGQGDSRGDGQTPREPGDGAGAPRQLGDPALAADAQRVLDEAGDIDITLINPDGTTRTVKASEALREVEEDAAAADALNACIVGAAEEAPF